MAAHLYCWAPSLGLTPLDPAFKMQVQALHELQPPIPPSALMLCFAEALLERFPNLGEAGDVDTVWATGPLQDEIIGNFIDFAVRWFYYEEARPFIVATATAYGLHYYDPQEVALYPATLHARPRSS